MLDLNKITFNPALVSMLPASIALKRQLLPCSILDEHVIVLSGDENNNNPEDLERFFGQKVKIEPVDPNILRDKIKLFYNNSAKTVPGTDQNEVIRLTDELIFAAVSRNASDIHINPKEDKVLLRLRIHGKLETYRTLPVHTYNGVLSRFKILSGMNIAEKRSPQDGKLSYKVPGTQQKVDIRVACIPSTFGEKMTLRLLGLNSESLTLDTIGMSPDDLNIFKTELLRDNGLVLINGATGSGKSTSLYASIKFILDKKDVNIITVEDPVEYQINDVVQVHLDESDKVTFPTALRSILRHDPDVIMIGEIRDSETANIAIKSSLTGHLVMTSLHANSASAAVARLADIGIEPYMIASTLRVSIAQKLVQKLCQNCCKKVHLSKEQAILIGHEELTGTEIAEKNGCLYCGGTGYDGRIPVFELLKISEEFRELIHSGHVNDEKIRSKMKDLKIPSMADDTILKLKSGIIDFAECYTTLGSI